MSPFLFVLMLHEIRLHSTLAGQEMLNALNVKHQKVWPAETAAAHNYCLSFFCS